MRRIEETFIRLRKNGEKALVGFVTAGDPTVSQSMSTIEAMANAGMDILELGVPFSDPTADGPVIQRSSIRALKAEVNLRTVLDMTRELREILSIPIVIFSYYNPILAYGLKAFYEDTVNAGADGVLVVDLPPEEANEMTAQWSGQELALIRLIAPTTTPERMASIARGASGFLYLVSMTGVTGSDGLDMEAVYKVIACLKNVTTLPICVGFGVSSPEQAAALAPLADGVVVGSAFERLIEAHLGDPECAQKVGDKLRVLKEAISSPGGLVNNPGYGARE
jgi:tryptophan synthase alpha chain